MKKLLHLDFVVLGAQKAGTTSVHEWLVQHPSVILPEIKETHFFSHSDRFNKGMEWYENQFSSREGDVKKGEIDPEYLFYPDAAINLKKYTDVNKFIIILRQPLQRAYSQYLMSVRRGFEKLPFDKALIEESDRLQSDNREFCLDHQSYLSRSLYSEQIKHYFNTFPNAEFLFIKFDELIAKENECGAYKKICDFIGVPYCEVDISKKKNQASESRFVWLRNAIYQKENMLFIRKLLSMLLSEDNKLRLAMFIDKINQKKISKGKALDEYDIDNQIIEKINDDIEKTEQLIGVSLSDWKQ